MENSCSISDLKNLKQQIENLHENEQIEIIKLLKKNEFKYTLNNNGTFIVMNKLSDDIIDQINKLLTFSKENNKKLEEMIEIRNKYKN